MLRAMGPERNMLPFRCIFQLFSISTTVRFLQKADIRLLVHQRCRNCFAFFQCANPAAAAADTKVEQIYRQPDITVYAAVERIGV